MRKCKICGELMKYNGVERRWECECGNIIDAVTIHGERFNSDEYASNRGEDIWI